MLMVYKTGEEDPIFSQTTELKDSNICHPRDRKNEKSKSSDYSGLKEIG